MRKFARLTLCVILLAVFLSTAYCKKKHVETDEVSTSATPATPATTDAAAVDPKKGPASAFIASLSSIIVSELGDKTFFIAAIMAMRYNRIAVLAGALFALFLMTAISTAFGQLVTAIVPAFYTHIITTLLFFFFGVKLLWDAYHEEGGEENNEKSEVELELNQLHTKMMEKKSKTTELEDAKKPAANSEEHHTLKTETPIDIESHGKSSVVNSIEMVASKLVFWQALTLTFLGEWGDRSQISTIALAANSSAVMVFLGGFLGHCCCTTLAVIGGKYLANRISEKMVNVSGGLLFLIFGIHNILVG